MRSKEEVAVVEVDLFVFVLLEVLVFVLMRVEMGLTCAGFERFVGCVAVFVWLGGVG